MYSYAKQQPWVGGVYTYMYMLWANFSMNSFYLFFLTLRYKDQSLLSTSVAVEYYQDQNLLLIVIVGISLVTFQVN